ncbi:MAG: PilZ domain-containing protein [Candidatus Omnitrophica bacterium]|nr:PilZ domain-containing protein [Candidatus Omnitrophota bacterium]
MEDRRIFPRIGCPKDDHCTVTGKASRFSGELMNISRKGALIVSKDRVDNDSKLDVVMRYPKIARDIPSIIQVVWSSFKDGNYTYGGKLVDINNEDKFDLMDNFYESWKRDLIASRS